MAMRKTLSSEDWAEAALAALAERGVRGVAVEPIAARLGATKGSFYHHFRTREALLAAALELWERRETEQVIEVVERGDGARERLRRLLLLVLESAADRNVVELALQPDVGHPLVAPVVERVTRRRLDYLAALLHELGVPPRRAVLAYTAYLGHAQLAHATPDLLPAGSALRTYVDEVITALVSVGGDT
jgi:AcrR family transcriptional regulator